MLKKLQYVVITFVLALSYASAAEYSPPQISVYGTATKTVKPDTMVWSLNVSQTGPMLRDVVNTHANEVSQVLKLLDRFKIADEDVQTSRMQFGDNWVRRDSSRVKDGFVASTAIKFTILSLESYSELWIQLAAIPGVSVSNVAFDHSRRITFRNEARAEALLAAKSKAAAMAATLDSAIGVPLAIEEEPFSFGPQSSNVFGFAGVADASGWEESSSLAPGSIAIQARVRVTFLLVTSE